MDNQTQTQAIPPVGAPDFPIHARSVVRSLRRAFSELLASVGADPAVPQAVSRQFGLNKNLAWRISKIVGGDDPAVVLQQMPGNGGLKIFLDAMKRAGAGGERLASARQAIDEYERLIRIHSGDRATLEMMGADLSPHARQQLDEQHRRLLFQGGGYVWGVQARVMLKVAVIAPGQAEGTLDLAAISGLLDFRRLRQQASWAMASRYWNDDRGIRMAMPRPEALDPRFDAEGQAPLMGEFCSTTLPALRSFPISGGTSFELPEGPIGNAAAVDCVLGTLQRGIPRYRTAQNEWGEHNAICDTPSELLIVDLFIHESMTFALAPEALLFSELRSPVRHPGPERDRNRLPLHETLQELGKDPLAPATPEAPRYADMFQALFARTGWDPGAFHAFRMKINYPACPTSLVLRYRLPEAQ